ncbi:MBL fold metallo-hydrolase [Paenibacillus arenilitoris]|uniref:MBL fold metallo-hydrolase n=1 Tax=Paenibacillus arenilitoris TaxID=2772299 RepID=A0A927CRJ5_9BACL|nr:MBL fold metallo-hydrolase [Paenibacillus arenilitoris]MBD2870611.1 MBL fold metallo-hydrolase [Paenibacillus arenilitoris]
MSERIRLNANVEGNFFVTSACIDCDSCRQIAPNVFSAIDGYSAVTSQPVLQEDSHRSYQALLACPTAAIGCSEKSGIGQAMADFPLAIADNVYYCGFTSAKSYGGSSYFIERPEGNWLIDSPRFVPALAKKLAALGGVDSLFLTHNDDDEYADAELYAKHFGAKRVVHIDERTGDGQTLAAEHAIEGAGPVDIAPDLKIIVVPGHSKGHAVLLYKGKYLFSGDHLFWDRSQQRLGVNREYCFYSWSELVKSMERLAREPFEWVLPRHGDRVRLEPDAMKQEVERLLNKMKETP